MAMKPNPEALVYLYDACKEYVRSVDDGEVRSVLSYSQMKAAINKAESVRRSVKPPIDELTVRL
jgi:hypothetical protein